MNGVDSIVNLETSETGRCELSLFDSQKRERETTNHESSLRLKRMKQR
jgi:hypothetical protein